MKFYINLENFLEFINKNTFNSKINDLYLNIENGIIDTTMMDEGFGTQLKIQNNIIFKDSEGKIPFSGNLSFAISNCSIFKKYLNFLKNSLENDESFILLNLKNENLEQIVQIEFLNEKNDIGFTYFVSDIYLINSIVKNDEIQLEGLTKAFELPFKDFYKILKNLNNAPGKNIKIYNKNNNYYIGFFYDFKSFIEYKLDFKCTLKEFEVNFYPQIFKILNILNKEKEDFVVKLYYTKHDDYYFGIFIIEKNKDENNIERFILISYID